VGRLPANAGAKAVAIEPKQPKRVYTAGDTGLFRSDDAGETWQASAQGLPGGGVAALALDPRAPQTIYAATPDGAVDRSDDGAGSWRRLAASGGGG